jgi:hypothetical protein
MTINHRVFVLLLTVLIVVLSVLDIFAGLLAVVPVIGGVFSSLSETLLEVIQTLATTVIAAVAMR